MTWKGVVRLIEGEIKGKFTQFENRIFLEKAKTNKETFFCLAIIEARKFFVTLPTNHLNLDKFNVFRSFYKLTMKSFFRYNL